MLVVTLGSFLITGLNKDFDNYVRHSKPYCSEDHYVFEDEKCSECSAEIKDTGVFVIKTHNEQGKVDKFSDYFTSYADWSDVRSFFNVSSIVLLVGFVGMLCSIVALVAYCIKHKENPFKK
jgi:hypothetical protein